MHIELVDTLRCLVPHEDSWLVGAFDQLRDRIVVQGELGCPVCGARYPIRDRITYFADPPPDIEGRCTEPPFEVAESTIRLAAMLGLGESGGIVLLGGEWGGFAPSLAELVDVSLVVASRRPPAAPPHADSTIIVGEAIPFASRTLRGIALDRSTSDAPMIDSAVRALRAGGRLVAPRDRPVPGDLEELARDDREWVAVRLEAPKLVPLGRGRD